MGSPQMKTPALPPGCMWRHSSSMMKFSYIRSVRIVPVGLPVLTIMPSRTENVVGATLTITQPERSLPLKSGVQPSSAEVAATKNAWAQQTDTATKERDMISLRTEGRNGSIEPTLNVAPAEATFYRAD